MRGSVPIDALTAAEAGLLGTADESLLAHAAVQSRVLITYDVDFLRLHAAGVPHAGIAYGPPDTSIGFAIGGGLLTAEVIDSDAMMNHVEFL